MSQWKLGMDGGNTMNCDLADDIAIVSEMGFDYLEVRDYKGDDFLAQHTPEEAHALFAQAGISPISLSAIELRILPPGEEQDAMDRKTDAMLKMASDIGCEYAIIAHMPPVPPGLSREQVIERVADDVKRVSNMAARYDIKVPYEYLGSHQCPIYNIADTMKVLELVNRDNIGWLFDFYHFQLTDRDYEALAQADVSKLQLIHMTDVKDLPVEELYVPNSRRALPGEGICDLKKILNTVCRMGYTGSIVIELYDKDYMSWDPREVARAAKEKTLTVLEKYYRPD